jgi:hypothetical protein
MAVDVFFEFIVVGFAAVHSADAGHCRNLR